MIHDPLAAAIIASAIAFCILSAGFAVLGGWTLDEEKSESHWICFTVCLLLAMAMALLLLFLTFIEALGGTVFTLIAGLMGGAISSFVYYTHGQPKKGLVGLIVFLACLVIIFHNPFLIKLQP